MLFGLWHSCVSPDPDRLLSSIVHDLMVSGAGDLMIDVGTENLIHFDIEVLIVGGDLPARSKCNKISAHNGFFSCTYCLYEGVSCTQHRHVLYPYVDFKQIRPPPRTKEHIAYCVEQIKQSNIKAFRTYGVYGLSPLIFNRCKEIYSVHALCHFTEQRFSFGSLAYHSMFAPESALHHFSKLAHGTISRGAQIAYWHCINRQIDTLNASPSPQIFTQNFF
ncbi:unnamed protein product [Rotaria sp. Silwood2]|nr:unnamed protein product [Rotaria sp. Silwood2]CAF2732743.1 unnamed protein product [Rotaria sp. Silwood2]CAF3147628.1 unnamed protein product [Rotaria sp. Silwood2]